MKQQNLAWEVFKKILSMDPARKNNAKTNHHIPHDEKHFRCELSGNCTFHSTTKCDVVMHNCKTQIYGDNDQIYGNNTGQDKPRVSHFAKRLLQIREEEEKVLRCITKLR
jgi:hypothetical protein